MKRIRIFLISAIAAVAVMLGLASPASATWTWGGKAPHSVTAQAAAPASFVTPMYNAVRNKDRICVSTASTNGAFIQVEHWVREKGIWDAVFEGECSDLWFVEDAFEMWIPTGWKCKSQWGHWYMPGKYLTTNLNGMLELTCVRI